MVLSIEAVSRGPLVALLAAKLPCHVMPALTLSWPMVGQGARRGTRLDFVDCGTQSIALG